MKLQKLLPVFSLVSSLSASALFAQSVGITGTAILNNNEGEIWDSGTLFVWVVDTENDGFFASSSLTLEVGDSLEVGDFLGASNDRIVARGTVGGTATIASIGGPQTFALEDGVSTSNQFGVFIFDSETSSSNVITSASTYSFYTFQDGGDFDWVIPSAGDNGSFQASPSDSADFQQLQGVSSSGLQVIPEPSTYAAIFGLGVLGFVVLRRKFTK